MKSLLLGIVCFTLLTTFVFSACDKDGGDPSCETVINANGPAFLKVINNSDEEILVDLTSIIPLGAQTRAGACEVFGLPPGSHTITIENESGNASKDVDFTLSVGQTYTLTVGENFF